MSDAEKEIGSLSKGVQELIAQLKVLGREIVGFPSTKGMMQGLLGGAANASAGYGQMAFGTSGTNMMGGSLADVNVQNFLAASRQRSLGFAKIGAGIQAGTGMLAGAMAAMPDLAGTTARTTGYYNAGIMGGVGVYGANGLAARGLASMAGGMQFAGADAAVANTLAAQGIMPGSSNFYNIMRSTAGVTRLTNMGNVQAAAALGGLTSGSTSAALMRNFGIFTTNPNTGQRYSPSQIFAQLQDRLTMGGAIKPTASQLMEQMHGGYLSQTLAASGMDASQQSIFFQGMLNNAEGGYKSMTDWSNPNTYSALQKKVGANPQGALYDIAGAQTGTQQAAMSSYVQGMQDAAVAVKAFQGAITNFLNSPAGQLMARGNAGLQTGLSDNSIGGSVTALTQVGAAGLNLAGAYAQSKMLAQLTGGGAAAARGFNPATAASIFKGGANLPKAGLLGIAGMIAKPVVTAAGTAVAGAQVGNFLGGAAQGALLGASIGSIFPGLGTGVGAAIGGVGGGLISLLGAGGNTSTINTGSSSATGGAPNLVAPVKGPITTKWGQTADASGKELWGGNPHKAIDYGVPTGTPVQASGDGVVREMGPGSGARSYGNYIIIDHGGGYSTLYAHLSQFKVSPNDTVRQGQVIALSGATGYATGPHLHFEVRKNGQSINPSSFLGSSVTAVAGNFATTASNAKGGTPSASGSSSSVGSVGMMSGAGASSSGYNSGAMSSNINIPQSYSGAAIAGSAAGIAGPSTLLGQATPRQGAGNSHVGGPGLGMVKGGNNVTINLTIAEASTDEARKFAQMVKGYLDKDNTMTSMGVL